MELLAAPENPGPVYIAPVVRPCETADDHFHAVLRGGPERGTILETLPEFAGSLPVDCEFTLPEIGTILVPGLNNPVFNIESLPACDADGVPTGERIVRLPAIHVHLNQALRALQARERRFSFDAVPEYSWKRLGETLRTEACALAARIVEKEMLRTRTGCGFMALAQANPALGRYEVGVGLELANDFLKDVRNHEIARTGESSGRFETVSDLAGLRLSAVIRFPATTSKSVRLDMHVVLSGRGRCCYLNPGVLKPEMEGDVDGDEIFYEIDPDLRRIPLKVKHVPVPNVFRKDMLKADFTLSSVAAVAETDEFEIYEGMDGKNGIGEATNLCYRGILISQIAYQDSRESRNSFWDYAGRDDLRALMLPADAPEEEQRRQFRHLSSLAVMDSIHPIYEGIFDLRKDQAIKEYILHFLRAVRGQEPMNFGYLEQMPCSGGMDVRPLELVWGAASVDGRAGRPTQFLRQYPISSLFFAGKRPSARKNAAMEDVFDLVRGLPNPARYIVEELNGLHYSRKPQPAFSDNPFE